MLRIYCSVLHRAGCCSGHRDRKAAAAPKLCLRFGAVCAILGGEGFCLISDFTQLNPFATRYQGRTEYMADGVNTAVPSSQTPLSQWAYPRANHGGKAGVPSGKL